MGYFTWTFCNRKEVEGAFDKYIPSCKLQYGGLGVVMCPDGSKIVEENYDGYGHFCGKDVYELVTDWNKEHLEEIYNHLEKNASDKQDNWYYRGGYFGSELKDLAIAYQNDSEDFDEILEGIVKELPYMKKDWKRNIGIAIACGESNDSIPYPIKISSVRNPRKSYKDLHPSHSTQ